MPEERQILAVKYSGARISELPAVELIKHAKGILFRIHAITGWKLPDDELYMNTLVNEFQHYMTESISDLNPEEVSYAMRVYGLDIEDWGKSMNLKLINTVMSRYRASRMEISEHEARIKKQQEAKKESQQPPKAANWQPIWEDILQAARTGNLENKIIAEPVYQWLTETGQLKLSVEDRKVLFLNAKNKYQAELVTLIQLNQITGSQRQEYEAMKNGEIENDLHAKIAIRAKIQAVKEFALETVKKEKK